MTINYSIPAESTNAQIEIKKSRFIAYADYIDNRTSAMSWLHTIKQQYPDARHHCWAYQFGSPKQATHAAMGDDGEPSGTAGKPILNVIQHKDIGDIMIIVVRYFGGIKLGAGGLTRAYGQAAQSVLDVLPIKQYIDYSQFEIICSFSLEQQIRHLCERYEGHIDDTQYTQQVSIKLNIPKIHHAVFCSHLDQYSQCEYKQSAV